MSEDKKDIPDHASMVRSFTSEKYGERFEPLKTLEEAKQHADGVVIFEGDYGGAIYLTCPLQPCGRGTLHREPAKASPEAHL